MTKLLLIIFLLSSLLFISNLNYASADITDANGEVKLENPLGNNTNPAQVINTVIKGILGLTGVIALVAFVGGGVIWMTSGGNPEKVKKGRDVMVWAVLGLFIIFSSYSILKYIFGAIT